MTLCFYPVQLRITESSACFVSSVIAAYILLMLDFSSGCVSIRSCIRVNAQNVILEWFFFDQQSHSTNAKRQTCHVTYTPVLLRPTSNG